MVRQNILGADLKYTRPGFVRERQHSAEVQIMGEYDAAMGYSPVHDFPVAGPRVPTATNARNSHPCLRSPVPCGRQVHVDEEPGSHDVGRGTSCSSASSSVARIG